MTEQGNACPSFDDLTDYWTKDASADHLARIEEHVFTCERCARVLAWAERLREGIGTLVQTGGFQAFVTDDVVNQLARDGVRVRSYALGPGESVRCAVWADDDILVTRLRGDFSGVSAIDAEMTLETGEAVVSAMDVPVRPGATEIVLALSAAAMRESPAAPRKLTLRPASGSARGGVVAEYVFNHEGTLQRDV